MAVICNTSASEQKTSAATCTPTRAKMRWLINLSGDGDAGSNDPQMEYKGR
jgi:hypothetical protein